MIIIKVLIMIEKQYSWEPVTMRSPHKKQTGRGRRCHWDLEIIWEKLAEFAWFQVSIPVLKKEKKRKLKMEDNLVRIFQSSGMTRFLLELRETGSLCFGGSVSFCVEWSHNEKQLKASGSATGIGLFFDSAGCALFLMWGLGNILAA